MARERFRAWYLLQRVWERIERDLPRAALERTVRAAPIEEALSLSKQLLAGKLRGRVILDLGTAQR